MLSAGSLVVSAPWAIAFVAANRELITELSGLLIASDGYLESAVIQPVVEGRIRTVTVAESNTAFDMLEPYLDQLKATAALVTNLRR